MFYFFSLGAAPFTSINSRNLKDTLNALILEKYLMYMSCENSNPNHLWSLWLIAKDKFIQLFSLHLWLYWGGLWVVFQYAVQEMTLTAKKIQLFKGKMSMGVFTYIDHTHIQKYKDISWMVLIQFVFAFESAEILIFSSFCVSSFDFII